MISGTPLWQHPSALDALAEELGVAPGDLDEAVLELAHDRAASAYNNGAYAELGDDEAYDQVHDDADARACAINAGVTDQLAFLAGGCFDEQALRSLLTDLLDSPPLHHARLTKEVIA